MANLVNGKRRDKKNRVLRRGESQRPDGKYQFKYSIDGIPHFVYSWRLEPTDKMPERQEAELLHSGRWKKPSEETSSHSLTRLAGI